MANRERNNQLKFYVTNEERFLIQNKMRESNVKNMGAYLRKMAIDGNIFILDNMPLKEMNMNLTRVGSNINQIAKRINSTDRYYKEDVTEIKEMLDEIWQLQKSILLKLP
ncbi:plasmid mobilization protein [Senegalia sp. (in: firmicutes)]|uniref:plasmid mobilization protein n=1 Tax=Senegalia sp. (in: firmicutes) TaxID=1924098 RepID=UPI003F9B969D